MTRIVNWDEVSDSVVLEADIYEMVVESLTETTSRAANKLMYKAVFRTVNPRPGLPIFENYVIGSDEDPSAAQEDTWKRNAGRLKRMLKAAAVPMSPDMDTVCLAARGHRLLCEVSMDINDGKRDASRKGQHENRIVGYYGLGERESGSGPSKKASSIPGTSTTVPSTSSSMAGSAITCPVCSQGVERAQYAQHAASHAA